MIMKENKLKYVLQYSYIVEEDCKFNVKNYFEYFDKHNEIFENRVEAFNRLDEFINIIKEENKIDKEDNIAVEEKLNEVIGFDKYSDYELFKNNFRKLGLAIALIISEPDGYVDDELREIIYIDGFGFDIPSNDYDKAVFLEIELMYYNKYNYKVNIEDVIECEIEDPGDLTISEFKFLKTSLVDWSGYEKKKNYNDIIELLINSGEGETIEFKTCFLYNSKYRNEDNNIKYTICKTIAGFANRNGGIVLIGINDNGQVIGLEETDLLLYNKDKLKNKLDSQINYNLPKFIWNLLKIRYNEIDNRTILIIEVKASLKPVLITNKDNQKEFYIRTTQGIIYLDIEDAINYCLTRFI